LLDLHSTTASTVSNAAAKLSVFTKALIQFIQILLPPTLSIPNYDPHNASKHPGSSRNQAYGKSTQSLPKKFLETSHIVNSTFQLSRWRSLDLFNNHMFAHPKYGIPKF
jgi:hypothetical protein